MDGFFIDITQNLKDFKHKLEMEPRVILSAGFGDGKTYFLKKFEEVYSDEYHCFTIYPAQYVIGTNEAIFEYIKRDLLYQIVDRGVIAEGFDLVGMLREMMEYVDITEVLSFFMSRPIASVLGNTIKDIRTLMKKAERHSVSASKYLDSFFSVRGGLYENDAYTCLIRKCFDKLREQDNKQIVLIIEDLDRIDPGNIFSILNIFGSHFDRHYVVGDEEQENKFGVDRLITVMDYDNLKTLYNIQYGEEAEGNFDGYIAKYICSTPFSYSIRYEARKLLIDKIYGINHFTFTNDLGMKLRVGEQLSKLSIREIERIYLFNPDRQLRDPDGTIKINDYLLSPKSPIVQAQAYRLFFNISCSNVRAEDKHPELLTHVEALGPLIVLKERFDNQTIPNSFRYGKHMFSIKPTFDDDGRIMTIGFKKAQSLSQPFIRSEEIIDSISSLHSRIWELEALFEPYFYYSPPLEETTEEDEGYD